MCYNPEPQSKNKTKVKIDVSHYATKSDIRKATGADTSPLAKNMI